MESFEIPDSTVNGAILLKQTYLRYLDTYEKIHYLGEDGDDGDDDDWYKDAEDSRSRRQKSQKVQNSIPLSYNLNQHNVSGNNKAKMKVIKSFKNAENVLYSRLQ